MENVVDYSGIMDDIIENIIRLLRFFKIDSAGLFPRNAQRVMLFQPTGVLTRGVHHDV